MSVLGDRGIRIAGEIAGEVAAGIEALAQPAPEIGVAMPKVFVVHGHDDGVKNEVAFWPHRIGMDKVILHEQPNQGRTIIAKSRDHAAEAVFAIVLATPDDVGGVTDGGVSRPRPRQNVILELGFFVGALGPERVAALVTGEVEMPADFGGVLYTAYDRAGDWKQALLREFKAAGIPSTRRGGHALKRSETGDLQSLHGAQVGRRGRRALRRRDPRPVERLEEGLPRHARRGRARGRRRSHRPAGRLACLPNEELRIDLALAPT